MLRWVREGSLFWRPCWVPARLKKISLATLKADKFYDRAPIDACDENWVHIAEHRDFWRECVVKPAKFHYNYRDSDEQVEYKTRPATSTERQRANAWDEWLLTTATG